jgi:hypothetical protein
MAVGQWQMGGFLWQDTLQAGHRPTAILPFTALRQAQGHFSESCKVYWAFLYFAPLF